MNISRIQNKIRDYAHQEYNNEKIFRKMICKLNHGLDIFNRKAFFEYVKLDDSYLAYIRGNVDKYSHLILNKNEISCRFVCLMYRYKYLVVDKLQVFNKRSKWILRKRKL